MIRRTSVSPKKHGEWLTDFHFQENVPLFINYMNIAKKRNCAKKVAQMRYSKNFGEMTFAQNAFFRAKS